MASARALYLREGDEPWHSGQRVMLRANQYNWLKGQVKRLARGGVAVWVAEAKLVVHVPLQLAASHLSISSSPPPTSATLLRLPTCQPHRYLLLAVRPSHLSHRALFQTMNKSPPFVDIRLPLLVASTPNTSAAALALPRLAVPEPNHQVDVYSENHSAAASSRCCQEQRHRPAGMMAAVLDNRQRTPANAQGINEFLQVSAPGNRLSSQTSAVLQENQPSDPAASGCTLAAEAQPEKAQFFDSPPLSPGSSPSHRGLKLLESIPESSDSTCCTPPADVPPTLESEEVVKTAGGRFSGPHLEVPRSDNGASSSSSSSSAATTPSPGRQTLAERIKKLKVPAAEKTSPNSQSEKERSNSQPAYFQYGSWMTIIHDGAHEKTERFPTH